MLCAESEFGENFEERLDVITPEKYIISIVMRQVKFRTVIQMTNL